MDNNVEQITYQLSQDDYDELFNRLKDSNLSEPDRKKIEALLKILWDTFSGLPEGSAEKWIQKIQKAKKTSKKNKDKTEDESKPKPQDKSDSESEIEDDIISTAPDSKSKDETGRNKPDPETRNNHGQNSASSIENPVSVKHEFTDMKSGCECPECFEGKLYQHTNGSILIIKPMPAFVSEVHGIEKLRCNACLGIFSAASREEITENTVGRFANESVAAAAVARYNYGNPFYRIEEQSKFFNSPVNDSSLWDAVKGGSVFLETLYSQFQIVAANADKFYSDDATIRIIQETMKIKANKELAKSKGTNPDQVRSGVHTTGTIADTEFGRIIIFKTGLHHSGEAMLELLGMRTSPNPFIFMSDAATVHAKFLEKFGSQALAVNCLQHARDRFVKIKENFPEYCTHILALISAVYDNDRIYKDLAKFNPFERLQLHQENSKLLMENLLKYCQNLLNQRQAEPNSDLGRELKYVIKHWNELSGFIRIVGAPLDNNCCEFILKIPKRQLKNSLAYFSQNGANVGDLYMTLTTSAKSFDINPLEYITKCLDYRNELQENPDAFMPWNFRETVKLLEQTKSKNRIGIDYQKLPSFVYKNKGRLTTSDAPDNYPPIH